MKSKLLTLGLLFSLLCAGTASADAHAPMEEETWLDKISLSSDYRFRFEWIDNEAASDKRDRWRLRARFGAEAEVTEDLSIHLRFASGGSSPVSTNQTLDGGFSSKGLYLDRAYLDWSPVAYEGVSVWAGKMKQPLVTTSNLIWDSDVTPEGIALKLEHELDFATLYANAAVFMAEERSSDDDTYLWGLQLAAEAGDDISIKGGTTYYIWNNIEDFGLLVEEDDSFGNSTIVNADGDLAYAEDFGTLELFTHLKSEVGIPAQVFISWITNTEASGDEDNGLIAGFKLWKAKKPGTFEIGYDYRDLEADAIIGAFTDSDSCGGGTDCEGHRLKGKYQLDKNLQFGLTYFFNKVDPNGSDVDYDRLQVDLIAKV